MSGVRTFFYGSWIDFDILKGKGVVPDLAEVAVLPGWEISMHRTANVLPREGGEVYGVLLVTSREEHRRLLTLLMETGSMGVSYLPEAAFVKTLDGRKWPALVYTRLDKEDGIPTREYLDSIVRAGRRWGFPESYLRHLEGFLS